MKVLSEFSTKITKTISEFRENKNGKISDPCQADIDEIQKILVRNIRKDSAIELRTEIEKQLESMPSNFFIALFTKMDRYDLYKLLKPILITYSEKLILHEEHIELMKRNNFIDGIKDGRDMANTIVLLNEQLSEQERLYTEINNSLTVHRDKLIKDISEMQKNFSTYQQNMKSQVSQLQSQINDRDATISTLKQTNSTLLTKSTSYEQTIRELIVQNAQLKRDNERLKTGQNSTTDKFELQPGMFPSRNSRA